MNLNEQELIALAYEEGFAHAVFIDTQQIDFKPSFRPFCADNVCGKYGANYACPPDCGTVDEMERTVRSYRRALVLQTMWEIQDPLSEKETKPSKRKHNKMTMNLKEKLGLPVLMVGAGGCDLCSPCAIVDRKPCRFPDRRFSCMSAYCIFVKDLCDKCGMEYNCGFGIVPFFSMLCFR